jgi:hypothetical protein
MNWFIIFCYIWFVYGISVIFTQGIGPFAIFLRIRKWTENIGTLTGMLFKCMLCFPTNVGWAMSLINWFLIPVKITPFNIILNSTNLWWLAMILDACFAGGITHLIWNIDDYIDKNTPIFEDEEINDGN